MNKNNWVWNVIIGIQIIVYIVLTTTIFVLQKKITIIETTQKKHQTQERNTEKKQRSKEDEQKHVAKSYEIQGKTAEAIKEYEKIIENDPKSAEAHFKLGMMHYTRGNEEEGVKHFKKVLEIEPNFHHKHSITKWIEKFAKKEQPVDKKPTLTDSQKQALQHIKNILKTNPDHPDREKLKKIIQESQH